MEIRTKNKLRKMKVKDLGIMKLSLCYNQETNDYEIYIRKSDGNAIIIQNASNCREICVLSTSKDEEILFAGEISNADIVNVDIHN